MTSARRTGVDQEEKKGDDFWSTWVDKVPQSLTAADSQRVCPLRHFGVQYRIGGCVLLAMCLNKKMVLPAEVGKYKARDAEGCPSVAARNSTKTTAESKALLQVVLAHAALRRQVLVRS